MLLKIDIYGWFKNGGFSTMLVSFGIAAPIAKTYPELDDEVTNLEEVS